MAESMQQNLRRLDKEQPIEMAADVQGNYPNFKQSLAEERNFAISKNSEKQPLLGKIRLRAAKFQFLTTMASIKEIGIWKEKKSQKAVFLQYFFSENWTQSFFAQLQAFRM